MKQTISAFMDGEADSDEALRAVESLTSGNGALRDDWAIYHLIRDTMQGQLIAGAAQVWNAMQVDYPDSLAENAISEHDAQHQKLSGTRGD